MRTAKQKQLLASHFLDLKETYMIKIKVDLMDEDKKTNVIQGLSETLGLVRELDIRPFPAKARIA
jgi:hypothetical protein